MSNISIENIYSLKDSLKPQMVRKFVHINYYAPTHIENRVNLSQLDCVKTLYFMRFKILYNFFNEHIDINDFTVNCMNLSRVRNELDRIENSTVHLNQSNQINQKIIIITRLEDRFKNLIIFLFFIISIIILFWILFFKIILKYLKTKSYQSKPIDHTETIQLASKLFIPKLVYDYEFKINLASFSEPREEISDACLTNDNDQNQSIFLFKLLVTFIFYLKLI
jgi:hypothetical protein